MTYILVFGDSTAYGAWDSEGGWPARLRKYLEGQMKNNLEEYYIVYNCGIDGHSTKDWLPHFEPELHSRAQIAIDYGEKIIVIVSLGANDSLWIPSKKRHSVPEDEFVANLTKLVNVAKKCTKNVFVIGPESPCNESKTNPVEWNKDIFYKNEFYEKYNKFAESVARVEKVSFINVLATTSKAKSILDKDGVHMNSKGHKIIFETVRDFLIAKKLI